MWKRVAGFLIAVLSACDDRESGSAPAIPQPLSTTVSGYRYYIHDGDYTLDHVDAEAAIELRVEEWVAGRPERDPDALRALAREYPVIVFPGNTVPGSTDSDGAGYCWWDQPNQQIQVAWQPLITFYAISDDGAVLTDALPALVHELDHALLGAYH